jgi:hypothetical protein
MLVAAFVQLSKQFDLSLKTSSIFCAKSTAFKPIRIVPYAARGAVQIHPAHGLRAPPFSTLRAVYDI